MKKALSLILAVLMLFGCMSVTAFAEETDNTTDLTLTVAKSFDFDMVIPDDVTNLDNFGIFEVGQAKVANVKNATNNTVISYTAETTDFKCDDKTDIPASYYTDAEGKTAFPTAAVEVYKNNADAASIPTMYVGISETDYNAAENGTYKATVTFNFEAYARINFKNVNGKSYFPVFSDCGNVKYFGKDGTQYTSMNSAINYALVPVGTTVHAIRTVTQGWNSVFYIEDEGESTVYPCKASGVNASFITSNLIGGNENTEQVLRIDGNPSTREAIPTYNGVALTDINNAYNFKAIAFISETLYNAQMAIRYFVSMNMWQEANRTSYLSICIVRDFTAQ